MEVVKKYTGLILAIVVAVIYILGFWVFPIDASDLMRDDLVNIHLGLAKYLVYALIILCVGFYIYKVIQNPKSGLKFGIGIGLLLLLFMIAYSGASSNITENTTGVPVEANDYKMVGGMITTTIYLIAIGVLALAGFTVKQIIQDAKA